jgi:hypothetical protein
MKRFTMRLPLMIERAARLVEGNGMPLQFAAR